MNSKGRAANSKGKSSRLNREADDRLPLADYPRTYNSGMGIVCVISPQRYKKNSPFPNNS